MASLFLYIYCLKVLYCVFLEPLLHLDASHAHKRHQRGHAYSYRNDFLSLTVSFSFIYLQKLLLLSRSFSLTLYNFVNQHCIYSLLYIYDLLECCMHISTTFYKLFVQKQSVKKLSLKRSIISLTTFLHCACAPIRRAQTCKKIIINIFLIKPSNHP